MRVKHNGKCHICGSIGPLTFEHIPPESAFNDRTVLIGEFKDIIDKGLEPITRGKIQQRGAGGYTLCAKCNNNTGSWYGRDYVDWCYQSLILYQRSGGHLSMYYPFHIFPLRVIKQIICMFFSVNSDKFRDKQAYLEKFVLKPDVKYLPPDIKIFTYIKSGKTLRQTGFSGKYRINPYGNKLFYLSEISFPPLGYVMTFGSDPPDERLYDITYFANYSYNDWTTVFLKLPILPVHLYYPGDYRSEKEILNDVAKNELDMQLFGLKK